MKFTDYEAKITLNKNILTITLHYPNNELARKSRDELLVAYQRGDPVTIELSQPKEEK